MILAWASPFNSMYYLRLKWVRVLHEHSLVHQGSPHFDDLPLSKSMTSIRSHGRMQAKPLLNPNPISDQVYM